MKMNVFILGASGAIGSALLDRYLAKPEVRRVIATYRSAPGSTDDRVHWLKCDLRDIDSIEECARQLEALDLPISLWVCASGSLEGPLGGPEKSMRSIRKVKLQDDFTVNTFGPILLFNSMAPSCKVVVNFKAIFLSAQVGSIEDNRLGGWYGYRMSKAALNMGVKCLAIEAGRWRNKATIVAVHPGTTMSTLSKGFVANRKNSVQTPEVCAARLHDLIEELDPEGSGKFYRLDGSQLPW
jgi:NAD(P)-dependent dehydrogenase (short-subunit alcohol dehydrogenase family)